jgi:hypothetical protein
MKEEIIIENSLSDGSLQMFYKSIKNVNRTFIEDKSNFFSFDFFAGSANSNGTETKQGDVKKLTVQDFGGNSLEKYNFIESKAPKSNSQIKKVTNIFKAKLKKSLEKTQRIDFSN